MGVNGVWGGRQRGAETLESLPLIFLLKSLNCMSSLPIRPKVHTISRKAGVKRSFLSPFLIYL